MIKAIPMGGISYLQPLTGSKDWLWGTDVKIVSALDEGIFDGEPLVDWRKV